MQQLKTINKNVNNINIMDYKGFIECLKSINKTNEFLNISINKDGLKFVGLDCANVMMYKLELLNSYCSEYNYFKDLSININLDSLMNILKTFSKDSILKIYFNDSDLTILKINDYTTEFKLKYSEDYTEQKEFNLNSNTSITINSKLLDKVIKDLNKELTSIRFKVNENNFILENEQNNLKVDLSSIEDLKISGLRFEFINSNYSVEYLKKLITNKLSDNIILKLSKDYPLSIEYKLNDCLKLTYILAPRVSND